MSENFQPTVDHESQSAEGDRAPGGGGGREGGKSQALAVRERLARIRNEKAALVKTPAKSPARDDAPAPPHVNQNDNDAPVPAHAEHVDGPVPAADGGERGGEAGAEPGERLNDAIIIGGPIDPAILDRVITIAKGRNRKDSHHWENQTGTVRQLLAQFSKFERGAKDGACYLQGALVEGATARAKKSVKAFDLQMRDIDNGVPLQEIVEKVRKSGLLAIIYPTHSHLKPETTIPENALKAYAKKKDGSETPTTTHAIDWLIAEKQYRPWVLEGAELLSERRVVAEVGKSFVVKHQPLPRARIVFVLDKPFDFEKRPEDHDVLIKEWEELYCGTGTMLDLPYDPTCTTPDRLMYPPRTQTGKCVDKIVILSGKLLDLEKVQRAPKPGTGNGTTNNKTHDPFSAFADGKGDGKKWKTKNLESFAKIAGHDFEAKSWLEHVTKTEPHKKVLCPNSDEHSAGVDTGFWVVNASENQEGGGFRIKCHHTCDKKSGRDRLWYLDAALEQAGITDAMDLISPEWTPEVWAAQEAEKAKQKADQDDLAVKVSALEKESTIEEIEAILRLMAKRPAGLQDDDDLQVIRTKTERNTNTLRRQLNGYRKEAGCESPDADDGSGVRRTPIAPRTQEEIEEYNGEIVSSWDLPLQLAIARSQIRRRNETVPRLFTRKGDPIALRLSDSDGRYTLEQPDEHAWSDELVDLVQFRRISTTIDRLAGMPAELSAPIKGSIAKLGLPIVEGIIRTPLFGLNGKLITARGYNKDLRLILDPNDVFDPPSLKPSDGECFEAMRILEDVICDFPYSDHFSGEEPLPYKIGEPDAAGYRETNFERGYDSRWNVWGAMLHPQVRHLMPEGSSAPAYHIDKAQPGEGAGYQMNGINIVLTGSELPVRVYNEKNPGEFEKGIPAALRAGDPMIGVDNITGTIRSGPLAAVLTSGVFVARRFGKNDEEMRIPTTAMWFFAGNLARFSDELADRMVPIGLNSGLTKPDVERAARKSEYFKYPHQPYAEYVKSVRRRVVWALHTIIARWFADGCPSAKIVHPRFPEYSAVVGGILENLARIVGLKCGFLNNLDAYKDAAKEDANAYAAVYQRIIDRFADHSTVMFTMSEAVDALRDPVSNSLDPNLNLPVSGRTPHGDVVAFSGLFRDELRQRPFDVGVDRRVAERHEWPVLSDLGNGRCVVRLKFIRGGKDGAERWRAVPVST